MFVGLSYKLDKEGKVLKAFCDSTNSWKVIANLEEFCNGITIHKTNLVQWVPLYEGKIRYPDTKEKTEWLTQLLEEIDTIKPKIVYLFWKQVSDFVIKKLDMKKKSDFEYIRWNVTFILAHHPSYMYIYKRKDMDKYIETIVTQIKNIIW
jgi:DNA polymerase